MTHAAQPAPLGVTAFDVGLVSTSDALADFYRTVFDLAELDGRQFPQGTVRRLQAGPAVLKIMVPAASPSPSPRIDPFWNQVGIRYLTFWVDDLSAVQTRCAAAGGRVVLEPTEVRPGVKVLMIDDPDGNAVEVMQSDDAS